MKNVIFPTFLIWGRGRDPNPSRPGTQGTGMQNRQVVPGWKGMGIEIENSSRDRDPFFRPVPCPSLGNTIIYVYLKLRLFINYVY